MITVLKGSDIHNVIFEMFLNEHRKMIKYFVNLINQVLFRYKQIHKYALFKARGSMIQNNYYFTLLSDTQVGQRVIFVLSKTVTLGLFSFI